MPKFDSQRLTTETRWIIVRAQILQKLSQRPMLPRKRASELDYSRVQHCHMINRAQSDRRARSSPKQPHQSTTPLIRQRAHDRSPNIGLHMLYSSYSSGSQEVHKDEHINVDEVSYPSIVNQDLPPKRRRLFRLSQIARGPAKLRWTQQDSALLRWWPEFAGCRGQSPSGCCSTFGTADDWHR